MRQPFSRTFFAETRGVVRTRSGPASPSIRKGRPLAALLLRRTPGSTARYGRPNPSVAQTGPTLRCRITDLAQRRPGPAFRWWRRRYRAGRRVLGPVRRRSGLASGHDVVDLVGVDGFVLQQQLGHDVQLVEVRGQQLPRARIGAIKDAAHHFVDLARRLVRNALVLRDRTTQE